MQTVKNRLLLQREQLTKLDNVMSDCKTELGTMYLNNWEDLRMTNKQMITVPNAKVLMKKTILANEQSHLENQKLKLDQNIVEIKGFMKKTNQMISDVDKKFGKSKWRS